MKKAIQVTAYKVLTLLVFGSLIRRVLVGGRTDIQSTLVRFLITQVSSTWELRLMVKKLDLAKVKFSDFYLALDMHQGLLTRSFTYEGKDTKVKFEFERFLHIP